MAEATRRDYSPAREEATGTIFYYVAMGIVAGAGVIAMALVPSSFVWLIGIVIMVLMRPIEMKANNSGALRAQAQWTKRLTIHFAVSSFLFVGSAIVNLTLVRSSGALWAAWAMGAPVFVAIAIGAWIHFPKK